MLIVHLPAALTLYHIDVHIAFYYTLDVMHVGVRSRNILCFVLAHYEVVHLRVIAGSPGCDQLDRGLFFTTPVGLRVISPKPLVTSEYSGSWGPNGVE